MKKLIKYILLWFFFLWINQSFASVSLLQSNVWEPSYILKWTQWNNFWKPSFILSNRNIVNSSNQVISTLPQHNLWAPFNSYQYWVNWIKIIDLNNWKYIIIWSYKNNSWMYFWYAYKYNSLDNTFTAILNPHSITTNYNNYYINWTVYNNNIYIKGFAWLNLLYEYNILSDVISNVTSTPYYSNSYLSNLNNYFSSTCTFIYNSTTNTLDSCSSIYYSYYAWFVAPQTISQWALNIFYHDVNLNWLVNYSVLLDPITDTSFSSEYFNLYLTDNNLELVVSIWNKTWLISNWIATFQWDFYSYNTANTSWTQWSDLQTASITNIWDYYKTPNWLLALDLAVINWVNYLYFIDNLWNLKVDIWAIVTLNNFVSPGWWDWWDWWSNNWTEEWFFWSVINLFNKLKDLSNIVLNFFTDDIPNLILKLKDFLLALIDFWNTEEQNNLFSFLFPSANASLVDDFFLQPTQQENPTFLLNIVTFAKSWALLLVFVVLITILLLVYKNK